MPKDRYPTVSKRWVSRFATEDFTVKVIGKNEGWARQNNILQILFMLSIWIFKFYLGFSVTYELQAQWPQVCGGFKDVLVWRVPQGCCQADDHTWRTTAHTAPQCYLGISSPQTSVEWLQRDRFPSSQTVSEATFSLPDFSLSFAFFPQSPGLQ